MVICPYQPKSRKDFHVAIICALPLEANATEALFDRFWDDDGDQYGKAPGDQNAYRTGTIGNHNVVLAYMPDIGKSRAASVAANFRSSFQNIHIALIVGICGGVPTAADGGIFLGDIIISDEIVLYDFGRKLPSGFRRKETLAGSAANDEVRAFLIKLKSRKGREDLMKKTQSHLDALKNRTGDYCMPSQTIDRLFEPTYHHKHEDTSSCKKCRQKKHCQKAHEATCKVLGCDLNRLVIRPRISPPRLNIHFGRMASGDTVMKSGEDRDKISQEENVIGFEMEGAGAWGNLPCLVIKGVCDYADSHKDKKWQTYTAGAAAACMKSLLEQWPTVDKQEETFGSTNHLFYTISSQKTLPSQPDNCNESFNLCDENNGNTHDDNQNEDGDLLQVLPKITSSFKDVLSCFKKNRKHLPRDSDLKSILRTQRAIFISSMEIWQSKYGSGKCYSASSSSECFQVALAVRAKLKEIEGIAGRLPFGVDSIISRGGAYTLKESVEDLQSLIQVFTSSIARNDQQQTSTGSTRIRCATEQRNLKNFRTIQQAANSLYNAFMTACRAHAVHDVYLSLQPDLSRTLTRVKFNVAFIQDSAMNKATWINVESNIKSLESSHLPKRSSPSVDSRKRQKLSEEAHDKRIFCEELSCDDLSKSPLRSYATASSITIPNLFLQRNFCTIIERSLKRLEFNTCIGLLGDNETFKHLAYMSSQVNQMNMSSLSQVISCSGNDPTKCMGLYERVRLARHLATAVLYYHVTPWLKRQWDSENIQLFTAQGSSIEGVKTPNVLPFMTTSIQGSGNLSSSQSPSVDDHQIIRSPVLFGLGVMLLELAYQAPMRSLQRPEDRKRAKNGPVDYFTAQRLADRSYQVMGSRNFQRIVKKCLHCDFGHDNDFTNTSLQEAFYHDVIMGPAGLQELERVFREMQLDD